MRDLALAVSVTRDLLGLPDLDCNDHINYYVAATFLGGQVQWNRTQATSPFLDGAVTTNRTRQMVTEQVVFEVLGGDLGELRGNIDALVAAFIQDSFQLNITMGASAWAYQCEAADYQVTWNPARMIACQTQVTFGVPRQPTPLIGVA